MNEMPSFVKWADEDIIKTANEEMIPRMSEWRNGSFDLIQNYNFEEIRSLATVMSVIVFNYDLYVKISFEQKSIEDRLNAAFYYFLGDLLPVYNLLDTKFIKEKWNGDQRYSLLALHSKKGHSEMSVLKNVVWISKLIGSPISLESAEELNAIMSCTLFCAFEYEYNGFDPFESPEKFEIVNECRKKEIEAQNLFVYYVLNKQTDKAYEMIEEHIKRFRTIV